MKNRLIDHFSKLTSFSEEELDVLRQSIVITEFKKDKYLLKQGQISNDTYYVAKGCVRQFVLTDGEEKTINFFTEDQWIISLNAFSPNTPSSHNLICLEDTFVVIGNEKSSQELLLRFPRFETIARMVMEAAFSEHHKLSTSYLTDLPEQRYLNLLKTRPDLFQRVPQYYLASYIGVAPESLSRIRKRIHSKS